MKIILPVAVEKAIDRLNCAGYEAYAVGGCVRDSLLGNDPADWDITTSALPEQIMQVFSNEKLLPIGLAHGTVTVLINNMPLEITTYRVDGNYSDNRHPDSVSFTRSLRDDLLRRDFTVNAMAYHPDEGIVDPFSGMADLEKKQIVCVGDPQKRLTEDALRILRALRFSSVLGFSIEKATAKTLCSFAPLLSGTSPERIPAELKKVLCGQNCKEVLLRFPQVITAILPELTPSLTQEQKCPFHYLTVYEHTVETVIHSPALFSVRFAMLLHDCGKPACHVRDQNGVDHFKGHPAASASLAQTAMRRLRMDNKTVQTVTELILHHDDDIPADDTALLRWLNRFGEEHTRLLLRVELADAMGKNPDERIPLLQRQIKRLEELLAASPCYSLKTLQVNGDDLIRHGIPAGTMVGEQLQALLDAVMDGKCPNEKQALLQYLNLYLLNEKK